MSELIAEARVLVTPDTTTFRQLLVTQLAAITKTIPPVPVAITPVVTSGVGAGQAAANAAATAAAVGGIDDAVRGATDSLDEFNRKSPEFNRNLANSAKGASSAGLSFFGLRGATLAAGGGFLAGAAGAIALGNALKTATSFNSEIATLGAVTDATSGDLRRAAEAAREFGSDITLPGVTAQDAAVTITAFSKAGLDLEQSIDATRGGLQLAQAAQLSFTDAVELSAGALNAFNLEGDQAVRVADVLANASNLAQGGITDTALALRQAAAAAQVVGVSFEDTAALLTLLARNGLTGSDAGTALRTSFLRLVNPSKEAAAVLRSLNVQLRDAQGNLRPEVFAEFAAAQRDLTKAQQQANAAVVFGQDAFRAFGILGAEGAQGLQSVQEELEKTGTAAELARARMTGLAGASENLSNQVSTLGLSLGQALTPVAISLTNSLAKVTKGANLAFDALRSLGEVDFDINTENLEELSDRLVEVREEAQKFRESGGFDAPSFNQDAEEIIARIEEIGKALLASPGGVESFTDTFRRASPEIAKALEDGVITPAEEAQLAITDMGRAFLNVAPGDLFSGGFSKIKRDLEGIKDTFSGLGRDIANTFFVSFEGAWRSRGAEAATTVASVAGSLTTSLELALAQAQGDQAQELSVLRQRETNQQKFLDQVLGREQTEKNVILAIKAAQNLERTRAQITAIVEKNASDADAARREQERIAKDAQRESDRSFLTAQGDARSRQERLVGLAQETEGVQDDIRRRQELRALITRQIRALRESAVEEKTKQDAIKALAAAKQATSDEINKLVRTQAEQNRAQREARQEELESAQIALGESILNLTGNKNPLLRAIDAAVRDAIKERNAAKKGSLAFVQAQTEINNLLTRRKEILEEAQKASDDLVGGTSLVDLFTQATDIAAGAGNVGFSAQGLQGISAIPRIQSEVQERLDIVNDPAAAAQKQNTDAIDRLINSLNQLNDTLTNGNSTTGGPLAPSLSGAVGSWGALSSSLSMASRFRNQKVAEEMVQNGLVGGAR